MSKGKKRKFLVGVDLGGSSVKAIVMDEDLGELLFEQEIQFPIDGRSEPGEILRQLKKVANKAVRTAGISWRQVEAIGLCTPGPASADGVIYRSGNLPRLRGYPIREKFEAYMGVPVYYANDCNAAALAEFWCRRHQKIKSLVGLFIGTGLGGGKVHHGKLVVGNHGAAMEIGHMQLVPALVGEHGKVKCGCGRLYHAEGYISLTALSRRLNLFLKLKRYANHPLHHVPNRRLARAKKLLGLYEQGDALATKLLMDQAVALGFLLHVIVCSDDPDVVVIGGGVTLGSEAFKKRYMATAIATFKKITLESYKNTQFEWARGRDAAAAIGAALHARNKSRCKAVRKCH